MKCLCCSKLKKDRKIYSENFYSVPEPQLPQFPSWEPSISSFLSNLCSMIHAIAGEVQGSSRAHCREPEPAQGLGSDWMNKWPTKCFLKTPVLSGGREQMRKNTSYGRLMPWALAWPPASQSLSWSAPRRLSLASHGPRHHRFIKLQKGPGVVHSA